jgi:hypothetical protein
MVLKGCFTGLQSSDFVYLEQGLLGNKNAGIQ